MKRAIPLILLSLLAGLPGFAKTEDKPSNAKLRLPWEVLRDVLKLDPKNVRLTWDEYKTLLRLTSPKKIPEFSMMGGDVVLSREEFTRLIQSLVPPPPASAEATISKASYRGRLAGASAIFSAFLRVEVPRRPAKPIRLDLFPGRVAFQNILLDGKPALAEVENGRLYLTLAEAGSHKVELQFSFPVPESTATQSLTIPIARTPITEWILDIPEKNLDISVNGALHREVSAYDKGTRVRALLSSSDDVTAVWNPLAPDTAKGPAQVYADVDHLISVQEDALRIKSRIGLEVLQNTINSLTLTLPAGFTVLDVQGEAVREWQENAGKPATLAIPFRAARKGRLDFVVVLERVLSGEKSMTTFTGVTVQGAVRQRGYLGVELNSDAELPTPVTEGLEPKDPFRELPASLAAQSARLLFGYKYVRPPFALNLSLSRHESVNVVPSVIDRAEGTTVVRPDGKNVHQVTYWIRSSAKQFLEVSLPEGTHLWSAFVDRAPVKPVHGEGVKTLIPLVRSLRASNNAFPVELVSYEERRRLSPLGREDLRLPMPDVLVSRLQWSVITPPEQEFFYFGRDFDKPPSPLKIGSLRSFGGALGLGLKGRAMGNVVDRKTGENRYRVDANSIVMEQVSQAIAKDKEGFSENGREKLADVGDVISESRDEPSPESPPPSDLFESKKMAAAQATGGGMSATAGLLPVRVNLPPVNGWSTVVYSKTLPEPNALLTLPLYHAATWIHTLAWYLPYLLLALLAWIIRARLRRWTATVSPRLKPLAEKAGPLASPFGALFTGLLGVLGASYGPSSVFVIALILYSVALVRWVLSLFDPAEGEKI